LAPLARKYHGASLTPGALSAPNIILHGVASSTLRDLLDVLRAVRRHASSPDVGIAAKSAALSTECLRIMHDVADDRVLPALLVCAR
jgi:hypothetical protein